VDTIEGGGRLGRSVWLALEASQRSTFRKGIELDARLQQVATKVEEFFAGELSIEWDDRVNWSDLLWARISVHFDSIWTLAFGLSDGNIRSNYVASIAENQVALAFRVYTEVAILRSRIEEGNTEQANTHAILSAASRVNMLLDSLVFLNETAHSKWTDTVERWIRSPRLSLSHICRKPTNQLNRHKLSNVGSRVFRNELCIIVPNDITSVHTASIPTGSQVKSRRGKPSKTITLHGFECVCCSPEGDIALLNSALGKLMGSKNKAADFDVDAVSSRVHDADGLGGELIMPSVKGRLNIEKSIGDCDDDISTSKSVPWHIIVFGVAYVLWTSYSRVRKGRA